MISALAFSMRTCPRTRRSGRCGGQEALAALEVAPVALAAALRMQHRFVARRIVAVISMTNASHLETDYWEELLHSYLRLQWTSVTGRGGSDGGCTEVELQHALRHNNTLHGKLGAKRIN